MTPPKERRRGISGSTIKIIAVVTMMIDHIAASLLTRLLIARGIYSLYGMSDRNAIMSWWAENGTLYDTVMVMREIGRLGFPIFCFLLVEGFQKTRNVRKYLFRLGMFALISEIPFDLAFSARVLEFQYQNVYFTLFIGILALYAIDWLMNHTLPKAAGWCLMVTGVIAPGCYFFEYTGDGFRLETLIITAVLTLAAAGALACFGIRSKRGLAGMQQLGAAVTVGVIAMLVADLLRTDYSGMGVLTILVMYIFRKHRVLSAAAGCVVLTVMALNEITAFFVLIPIALYNGRRGLKMKYFFYAFYPAHLLILWLIAAAMGMGWIAAV
jgi:hypothetical protein